MRQSVLLPLFISLLLFSCGGYIPGTGGHKVDYDLQGEWESSDGSVYNGSLTITYDSVKISGYSEGQTKPPRDDNERPFKGFTKNTALKAYTEEGFMYIEDFGIVREGIPYSYWESALQSDHTRKQLLRFTFGGREEELKKKEP